MFETCHKWGSSDANDELNKLDRKLWDNPCQELEENYLKLDIKL